MLLRSGKVFISMQEGSQVSVFVPTGLLSDERVSQQHGFEPRASVAGLVPDLNEMLKVLPDLTFMPSDQECLYV